jgi:hypothetical protein
MQKIIAFLKSKIAVAAMVVTALVVSAPSYATGGGGGPDISPITDVVTSSGIESTLTTIGVVLVSVAIMSGLIMMVVKKASGLGTR